LAQCRVVLREVAEKEMKFTSSMGHSGKGIRVSGRLEVVGGARGVENHSAVGTHERQ
jgi:hypothetical protein